MNITYAGEYLAHNLIISHVICIPRAINERFLQKQRVFCLFIDSKAKTINFLRLEV